MQFHVKLITHIVYFSFVDPPFFSNLLTITFYSVFDLLYKHLDTLIEIIYKQLMARIVSEEVGEDEGRLSNVLARVHVREGLNEDLNKLNGVK